MAVEIIVRVLKPQDLEAIVAIDARITGTARPEYYRRKIAAASRRDAQIDASLVAEADGRVVGFLMGTLSIGEFGVFESTAVLDALGVDAEYRDRGVGGALFDQFRSNMRGARVERIYTLVDWGASGLLKFFGNMGFEPSRRLSLECRID